MTHRQERLVLYPRRCHDYARPCEVLLYKVLRQCGRERRVAPDVLIAHSSGKCSIVQGLFAQTKSKSLDMWPNQPMKSQTEFTHPDSFHFRTSSTSAPGSPASFEICLLINCVSVLISWGANLGLIMVSASSSTTSGMWLFRQSAVYAICSRVPDAIRFAPMASVCKLVDNTQSVHGKDLVKLLWECKIDMCKIGRPPVLTMPLEKSFHEGSVTRHNGFHLHALLKPAWIVKKNSHLCFKLLNTQVLKQSFLDQMGIRDANAKTKQAIHGYNFQS